MKGIKNFFKNAVLFIKLIPAKIKDFFTRIYRFFDEFPEKTNSYSNLSSTNVNVRKLKSGIRDKNINTIALLGDFSSGKSSIVFSSLPKKYTLLIYPNNDKNEDKNEGEKGDKKDFKKALFKGLIKNDISSISPDQATYRKYIKRTKLVKLYLITFLLCGLISGLLFFLLAYFSGAIKDFLINNFGVELNTLWIIFLPILIGFIICIFGTINICNYCISLKIKGVTIEGEGSENKDVSTESVFTCIIYHIIRRKIRYIVFEDLDRSMDEEFTLENFRDLRDFCLKINSSPQIKKPIKFIYCFSDKIFKTADERLKSFDLIIPVFPKMTVNNSYEALCRQDIILDKGISKAELANLSIFISNQRLYNSIIYEFRLMCNQIHSSDYNEMFAICCIKNIFPILYHELFKDNNFLDKAIDKMVGDLDKFKDVASELTQDIGLLLNSSNSDKQNAVLLLKICITNKYISKNYKNIIHSGGNNYLSNEDILYLKSIAAMECVDPNIKLSNFEIILDRVHSNLKNPKFFNISLMKYCIHYNKTTALNDIVDSLKQSSSEQSIVALLKSRELNDAEISYLNEQLYLRNLYVELVISSNNNDFINSLLTYILKKKTDRAQIPSIKIDDKISAFYYNKPDYFVKLETSMCSYFLCNYEGTFKDIPIIEVIEKKSKVYEDIILYKRYNISVDNLNILIDGFVESPLNHIFNNKNILNYVIEQNKIEIINHLNKGNDTIEDLINLLKFNPICCNELVNGNYIKQFYYSVDLNESIETSLISSLVKLNLISFTSNNIIRCIRTISSEDKYDIIVHFIKNSVKNSIAYNSNPGDTFDCESSLRFLTELTKDEIMQIKESIDLAAFDNAKVMTSLELEKLKIFQDRIKLSRDTIINMLDNNIEDLKRIINECPGIEIDDTNCTSDSERLKIAKSNKLKKVYSLFK